MNTPTSPRRERRWKLVSDRDGDLMIDPAGKSVGYANSKGSDERLVACLNELEKQVEDLEHALLWAIDSEHPGGCVYCTTPLEDGEKPQLCPAHRELEKVRKCSLEETKR